MTSLELWFLALDIAILNEGQRFFGRRRIWCVCWTCQPKDVYFSTFSNEELKIFSSLDSGCGSKKRGEETHGKTHWFGWKTLRWKTLAKKTLKPRSFYGIVQVLGWYSSCLFGTTSTSEPWRVERTMPMSNTWVASRTPQVQYELGHTVSHSEFKYIYIYKSFRI